MRLPSIVPVARVRRLSGEEDSAPKRHHVTPSRVPAPHVVPRQIDPVGLRLMALQTEVEHLRAELDELRAG